MKNGRPSLAIVYHSGYGHTARVAEHVAQGAREAGAEVRVISVDDVDAHWDDLAASDAIVFGSPTYMGSASGPFKTFMDKTSKVWFELGWKDKVAAGFSHSGSPSGDKLNTIQGFQILAAQHAMVWVGNDLMPGNTTTKDEPDALNRLGSFAGLMTQSPTDAGPETIPEPDLRTAEHFGARVARATARWNGATPGAETPGAETLGTETREPVAA